MRRGWSRFNIEEDWHGGVRALVLSGELDLVAAPRLESRVADGTEAPLVLDLSGIRFMDSSGVHVLLEAHAVLERRGSKLSIACPDGQPRRVLEVTGVLARLPVFETIDAAVAAATTPPRDAAAAG